LRSVAAAVIHNAFPDFHLTTEDAIAEKDKVALRWESTSTHKGEFMGIPATNKKVSRGAVTIYRIVGGRIVEWWNKSDLLTIMQQLGVFLF
jgi:predicted ester cyclase